MSDFKGTKGKWVVGTARIPNLKSERELVISLEGGEKVENGYRIIACITPMENLDDIDLANAQLIACAPEMLEMLERIVLMTQTCQGTFEDFRERYNIEINALIKKATEI